jgi:hypothetical protein
MELFRQYTAEKEGAIEVQERPHEQFSHDYSNQS